MLTYGPFSGIYFMIYEEFKNFSVKHLVSESDRALPQEQVLHAAHYIAGGFVAGTMAAILTAPIDLVKTRIQVFDSPAYSSITGSTIKIFKEEGVRVFFAGLGARVVWIAPGCALTVAVYEDWRKFLHRVLPGEGKSKQRSPLQPRNSPAMVIRHRPSGVIPQP
eukprot:CAMPEP_0184313322 /NCGR_PEP_ID=MMETSP1049-20130417/62023_1 /TAXON_ID=77928 /ORGANISM="Proteomonas sulcata, Strain CCMP704" /LENGTH=163 /DNA_ID=CAMNT_0026630425 /DNA_START=1 /DNA_END=492 /DNA_ORIENTATION=+